MKSSLVTLQDRKRKAAEGYILDLKCENTAEFLAQLSGMCQNEHCLRFSAVSISLSQLGM